MAIHPLIGDTWNEEFDFSASKPCGWKSFWI